MAFQRVPDTWELKMKGQLPNGAEWQANLYLLLGTYAQPTTAAADAWMQVIHDAYTDNNFDDELHASWHFDTLVVTGLNAATDDQAISTAHPVVGTIATEALPNSVAALMNWRTGSRGRSYRGRTFHPGWTEASSVGGGPRASGITAFEAWAADIIAGFDDGAGRNMVVVSRYSGMDLLPGPRPGELTYQAVPRAEAITTQVLTGDADTWFKTQRRRGHAG